MGLTTFEKKTLSDLPTLERKGLHSQAYFSIKKSFVVRPTLVTRWLKFLAVIGHFSTHHS